jgi:hypothetical protein
LYEFRRRVGAPVFIEVVVACFRFFRAPIVVIRDTIEVQVLRRTALPLPHPFFVGAIVPDIRHAIPVVVRVRAPVVIVPTVDIFRGHGARVSEVRDQVLIVVGVGAPIPIFELVHILCGHPARIHGVHDSVSVAVFTRLGAPVVIVVPVKVFGFKDTAVVEVQDPVAIVISRGVDVSTAILVLVPVAVFRFIRAGVHDVGHAI